MFLASVYPLVVPVSLSLMSLALICVAACDPAGYIGLSRASGTQTGKPHLRSLSGSEGVYSETRLNGMASCGERGINLQAGWAIAVGGMSGGGMYTLAGVILGEA